MDSLISWEDFDPLKNVSGDYEETNIKCPICDHRLKRYIRIVLTSNPPQSRYDCLNCGWSGYK